MNELSFSNKCIIMRRDSMKKFIVILAIFILTFGCTGTNGDGTEENVSVVEYGDNVSVYYILSVDGEVKDTNIESIANQSGLYNPDRSYVPFSFTVLHNHGIITGFVDAVVGMKEGETKNITVFPEEGYGAHDPSLRYTVPRYYNKSSIESVPVEWFEERNLTYTNGTAYDTDYGKVFVESFNETHVELFYILQPGDKFTVNGLPQKVVALHNLTLTIEYDLDLNEYYYALSPVQMEYSALRAVNKTNDTITIDENHEFAGKYLDYQITLVSIEEADG